MQVMFQSEEDKKISKRIRKKLIDEEKSITELANDAGITRVYLSNILTGKTPLKKVSKGVMDGIAKGLNMSTIDLFYN